MLTQYSGDCGDPNNTFAYFVFAFLQTNNEMYRGQLRYQVQKVINSIQVSPGVWIRHPDDNCAWHADPKEFSRDQWVFLVIMLSLYGFWPALKETYNIQRKNNGKYQNKDVAIPTSNFWGLYWRALGISTWMQYLADTWLLVGVIIHCLRVNSDPDNVGDDKNQVAQLLAATIWRPTWISNIAVWFYKTFRKDFSGGTNGAQYAFDHYYRPATGAPPLNEFAKPTLSKLFDR